MRCKKLRKTYFKYMDGLLSERKSRLLEEHIHDCPDCSAEAKALERICSSLREAGRIKVTDNYWDTYWERLEARLPDRPSPVTLRSRLTGSFSDLFQRPLVLGRIVIYALLLAFVIYIAPDRMVDTPSEPLTSALDVKMQEEKASLSERVERDIKAGNGLTELDRADRDAYYWHKPDESRPSEPASEVLDDLAMQPAEEAKAGVAKPELPQPAKPVDYNGIVVSAPAVPAGRPAPTVEAPLVEAESSPRGFAGVEDEYAAAERYFGEGEYVQAIPAYQNFITANTIANVDDDRNLRAQYQIGEAYYQIGEYPEALSNFAAVAGGNVSEEEGRKAGTLDAAWLADKKSTALSTELEEQRGAKAVGEEEIKPVTAALDRPAKQNERIPDNREEVISQAMFRLAQSYEKLGQREEAITAYNRYVERYPDDDQALKAQYQIGEVYYQMGNYSKALSNFAAVADADVSEERGRKVEAFSARRVRARMEDKESAGLRAEDAKAKAQEVSKGVRVAAGRTGYAIRKDERAPDNLEKLVSQAMFRLAESYEKLGRRGEAIAAYREYVEKYPRGQYLPQAKEKIAQMKR